MEKDKVGSLPFGRWGEDIAAEYLEKKGFRILDRHFQFLHTEIDLVARDGQYLVFIEVKTRFRAISAARKKPSPNAKKPT